MSQTPSPSPPPPENPNPPPPENPNPPPPDTNSGYSMELYFDPALENQVLKAWNVLARRNTSNHLITISSRPHITLISLSVDPTPLVPSIKSLASRFDPLPLTLSSIAASPSSSDLFLAPTPTSAVLFFHAQLCEVVRKLEGAELREEYRVDGWVPRCAVAEDVAKSKMAEAFCILRDLKLPVSGYHMDIGLVQFSPVREIFSFPLGGSGNE